MSGLRGAWRIQVPEPAGPEFSFCERVTATPTSPLHIRELTARGLFTSGGADTAALCEAVVAWDTHKISLSELPEMAAAQHATFRICQSCTDAAIARVPRMNPS